MRFDEDYFKPETIEGFEVKGMMKRYWAASMEVLEEVDRLCRKYNLRYYAFYGTLLGAVRHKGWIPWDDDMDIIMYRDDFNSFVAACKLDLDSMFTLYNIEQSCLYPARLINTHYTKIDRDFLERFHGCPYPAGIDIYVMDKVPTEELDIQCVRHLHQVVRYLSQRTDQMYKKVHKDGEEDILYNDVVEIAQGIEEFTGEKLIIDGTLSSQLAKLANRIAAMYNDTDSPYLARINNWAIQGESCRWPKEWFDEIVYLPFDCMMLPCPKMYQEVLIATMGENYMTPIKFLNAHSYPAYGKHERELLDIFDKCGAVPPEYFFE